MSYFLTHHQTAPEKSIFLHELVTRITSDSELAIQTEVVRQGVINSNGNKRDPRVVQAKSALPAITVSGTVTERSGAKGFVPSGFIQADIDGLESEKVERVKKLLSDDPHIVAAFTSPTGRGVKAVVRVSLPDEGEEPTEWHAGAFSTVTEYMKAQYKVDIDPAPKNPASLMYLASDSDAVGKGEDAIPLRVAKKNLHARDIEEVSASIGAWIKGFKGDLRTIRWIDMLNHTGLLKKRLTDKKIGIKCPWEDGHSTESTGSDTAILLNEKEGGTQGTYVCLHGSCSHRKTKDFLAHIGAEVVDSFCERLFTPKDKVIIRGKPAIQLPGEDNLLSTFAEELGKVLRNQGVYVRGGIAFIVSGGECIPVEPAAMRTWIEQHATTYVNRGTGETRRKAGLSMSTDTAKAAFSAPQFLEQLLPLKYVMPTRVPAHRKSGNIELMSQGYDEETAVFTMPDGVEYPEDISLEEAVKFLNDELLVDFPFVEDGGRSKSVAIAAMLTVYAGGLLHPYAQKPTFVYVANSEGSGKTLLAMLAGAPYGVVTVTSPPTNETEWAKTLLSVVIGGRRLVIIDNVRGYLSSPSLEGYLTSPQYEGRILGQSKIYRGDAGAVVLITGNQLTVSPDQRRRSLFVELFSEQLRAEDRVFKRNLDQSELLRLQPKILSSLWALIRSWDDSGRPEGSISHASFNRWARVFGGILEHAGYANPCQRPEMDASGDRDTADMEKLCSLLHLGWAYEFSRLVEIILEAGLFERATSERDDNDLTRKGKAIMAKILARFDRKIINAISRFVIEGSGHNRRYKLTAI